MNKKFTKLMSDIASESNLSFNEETFTVYGVKNGISLCLFSLNQTSNLILSVSVTRGGNAPEAKEFAQLCKQSKALKSSNVRNTRINFYIKNAISMEKLKANAVSAINDAAGYLAANSYVSCCQNCGSTQKETATFLVKGTTTLLCEECFVNISNSLDRASQEKEMKHENVVLGIVGALIGSLIGVISIVLLGRLGYVSALSGILMAACTLKGYELLGNKLTKKGIVICAVLMIGMTYFAHRVDWAISAAQYFDVGITLAFRAVGYLIEEGFIDKADYISGFALLMLFLVVGAIPTMIGIFKNQKLSFETKRIGVAPAYTAPMSMDDYASQFDYSGEINEMNNYYYPTADEEKPEEEQ